MPAKSLERLQAEFDADVAKGGRNGAGFAIEADGRFIGQCALFNFQDANRTAELGIGIGDKDYWGAAMARTPCGCWWTTASACAT